MARRRASPAQLIDEDLVYRLLRLVNLIAKPYQEQYGARFDLTIAEWRLMMALAAHPEVSASEIADHTGMHVMNVSRGIARLVRMGRVSRAVDRADRRRATLRLTPAGLALFRRIAPDAQAREERVREALSAREKAQLRSLLDKLIEHVRADAADRRGRRARKASAR